MNRCFEAIKKPCGEGFFVVECGKAVLKSMLRLRGEGRGFVLLVVRLHDLDDVIIREGSLLRDGIMSPFRF
jgi:hypothetical protein